jgi:hypothetical protein
MTALTVTGLTSSNVAVLVQRKNRSLAMFQFQDNTTETPLVKDVWTQFANPSGSGLIKAIDISSDFEVVPGQLGIKYIGTTPKLFNLSAVTNIFRTGAGSTTRTLELQWKLNSAFVGFYRETQSNTESNIYTGNGLILLSPNDVLTPWVNNTENSDGCRLANASFVIGEEITTYFG